MGFDPPVSTSVLIEDCTFIGSYMQLIVLDIIFELLNH